MEPSGVVATLNRLLLPFSLWGSTFTLASGDSPQIDEQGFRFRLAGGRGSPGPILIFGTIQGSGSGSEVEFELTPSSSALWVAWLMFTGISAATLIGFWPTSVAMALGSTAGVLVFLSAFLAFGWIMSASIVGSDLAFKLSDGRARP